MLGRTNSRDASIARSDTSSNKASANKFHALKTQSSTGFNAHVYPNSTRTHKPNSAIAAHNLVNDAFHQISVSNVCLGFIWMKVSSAKRVLPIASLVCLQIHARLVKKVTHTRSRTGKHRAIKWGLDVRVILC